MVYECPDKNDSQVPIRCIIISLNIRNVEAQMSAAILQ